MREFSSVFGRGNDRILEHSAILEKSQTQVFFNLKENKSKCPNERTSPSINCALKAITIIISIL